MMKNLLRSRFLPAILCMALALGLSACGGKDTPPVETETDGAMGTLSGSKGEKDSGVGVFSGSGEETAEAELAEESLNLLYDAMAYDDQYAGAVAYLGYRKQGGLHPAVGLAGGELCRIGGGHAVSTKYTGRTYPWPGLW